MATHSYTLVLSLLLRTHTPFLGCIPPSLFLSHSHTPQRINPRFPACRLNRSAAPIQITAEQIILEARDRSNAALPPAPRQHITDVAELADHRLRKRKEFEDSLKQNHRSIPTWLRYAKWEDSQHEVERARSVYERALDIDFKNVSLWQRYAEMEMRNKFVNRARNVWDRAITLLPRMNSLWYKYTFMEEMLRNVAGARARVERWMTWEPEDLAWLSYVKLEERAGDRERARCVYERYVACHPGRVSYLRFAKWEERGGQRALARRVYERSMEELRAEEKDAPLYSAFARFEERCGEIARAQAIYRHALATLPKSAGEALYAEYVAFEKQHGDKREVEDVILSKRRAQYEAALAANPRNYDAWFDYVRLEESEAAGAIAAAASGGGAAGGSAAAATAVSRAREVYERAIANLPPLTEKRFWTRYMYLWIYYALFEELVAVDVERTRAVYREALKVVPHASFSFGKLWLLAAKFELRQKNPAAARKLLGTSLGMCPKQRVLRGYIELELAMGEIDRCRKLYERFLQLWPHNVGAWTRFADLERSVGEDDRARAIYDLAVSQPSLDMPEAAWKAFIDFEIERGDLSAARALYSRLLMRTQHAKVWLSLATFEATVAGDAEAARGAYSRGYAHFKASGADGNESRALLVETWRAFELALRDDDLAHGGDGASAAPHVRVVEALVPRKVVRRRELHAGGDPSGPVTGWEEYYDYIFPDDETKPASMKLLELAARWKSGGGSIAAVLRGEGGEGAGGSGGDVAGDAAAAASDAQLVGYGDSSGGGDEIDDGEHASTYNRSGSSSSSSLGEEGGSLSAADGLHQAAAATYADPNALDLDDDDDAAAAAARLSASSSSLLSRHQDDDASLQAAGGGGDGVPDGGTAADTEQIDVEQQQQQRPVKRARYTAASAGAGSVAGAADLEEATAAETAVDDAVDHELQLEEAVKAAPSGSAAPRDFYTEEDGVGFNLDRDV